LQQAGVVGASRLMRLSTTKNPLIKKKVSTAVKRLPLKFLKMHILISIEDPGMQVSGGKKSEIDKTIGTCIYTGILTDSGSFRFPKTTGTTHRIVAELIDLGVENTQIPNLLFDNSTIGSLQLLGRALENMHFLKANKTAYTTLSQVELDQFNYIKGDTEGIVNYGLSIKGIDFSAIFIENKAENFIKISFRSQGDFDVNQFARDYFNGGGHRNAAGGKSELSLQETVQKFETLATKLNL
jgi:phosphoesterase RecJ-like protein